MSTFTKKYATVNVGQLKQLLDGVDDEKEVRVWTEMNWEGTIMLEGRRLIGVREDPYDERYFCLIAGYYESEGDEEESE